MARRSSRRDQGSTDTTVSIHRKFWHRIDRVSDWLRGWGNDEDVKRLPNIPERDG